MVPLAPALLCLVRAVQSPAPATAQEVPSDPDQTPASTGVRALLGGVKEDIEHLPSLENLVLAGGGGMLALGVHPFDQTVNARVLNQSAVLNTLFVPGKYLGDTPEQLALSIGTWALGRALDMPKVSHLGTDLLRAQALTELMVEPLKLIARRERPDGSNHQSFPSAHAAITFAAATVIQRHLGWKDSLAAYVVATYVSASRLHDNQHYLSDVVFGAAIGVIAGRTVTAHGRDTWTFGPSAVPRGILIGATRTAF